MTQDWFGSIPGHHGKQESIPCDMRVEFLFDHEKWNGRAKSFENSMNDYDPETKKNERSRYRVDFSGVDFSKYNIDGIDFRNYIFPCPINFRNANFGNGDVNFSNARFLCGNISFEVTKFNGNIRFNNAKFTDSRLYFNDSEFGKGTVNFSRVEIERGEVRFNFREFESENFIAANMIVEGSLYVKATFPDKVQFKNLKVSEITSFSGSIFKNKVPDFRDASFGRPPEVSNIEVPRPILKKINDDENNPIGKTRFWHFECTDDKTSVDKYRQLKAMALAVHDHEKDGEFFSYEMMAKRGWETKTFWGLTFNSFYYLFSDYGQSLTRPAIGMLFSFIIFMWGYLGLISWYIYNEWWWLGIVIAVVGFLLSLRLFGCWLSDYDCEKKFTRRIKQALIGFLICTASYTTLFGGYLCKWNEICFAVRLSFNNFFPAFGTFGRFSPTPKDYTSSFITQFGHFKNAGLNIDRIVGVEIFQNIIGAALLFLFLLALRNKFRLK